MPLSLSTNISSLKSRRALGQALDNQSTLFQRLSSGSRINRASDDPASLAVSEGLRLESRIYTKGMRNLNDGISLLNVTDGAVNQLKTITTRISELAEQSANGTFDNRQRQALDREAQALAAEYSRIVQTTSFNGINLFTQSEPLTLQAGTSIIQFNAPSFSGVSASIAGGGGAAGVSSILLGNGDATFAVGKSFSIGSSPFSASYGDFNGDGNLDLASEDGFLLGNGDGTFKALQLYGQSGVTTVGDINGDGRSDIVLTQDVGGTASDGIRVLLSNGNGTFKMSTSYQVGGDISQAQIGDFNGDGVQDLITSNYNADTVSVILGNGDGTFKARTSFRMEFGSEITVADLNGDGILDVFGGNHDLQVLYGNGNGTFKAPATVFNPGANQIFKYQAGDVNGDGKVDIVAANYGTGGYINVVLGNGNGTFKSALTTGLTNSGASGSPFTNLIDINSDGKLDVVTSQADGIYFYVGNGDGTFKAGISRSFGVSADPGQTAFADFNKDGVLDLLAADWTTNKFFVFNGNPIAGGGASGGSSGGSASSSNYSSLNVDITTQTAARNTLSSMTSVLDSLNIYSGHLGAFQSRLSSSLRTLDTINQQTVAADSRIRDLDMAKGTADLVASQMRASAAAAVLAQANQQPAIALSLLRLR